MKAPLDPPSPEASRLLVTEHAEGARRDRSGGTASVEYLRKDARGGAPLDIGMPSSPMRVSRKGGKAPLVIGSPIARNGRVWFLYAVGFRDLESFRKRGLPS